MAGCFPTHRALDLPAIFLDVSYFVFEFGQVYMWVSCQPLATSSSRKTDEDRFGKGQGVGIVWGPFTSGPGCNSDWCGISPSGSLNAYPTLNKELMRRSALRILFGIVIQPCRKKNVKHMSIPRLYLPPSSS
jgi:hypothetical protein